MLASTRHHTRARRGIVLVLVLAMLGLLALIGVTFATFSGQARINARIFAQSVIQPQDDELMDFALQQLITDTSDVRSAIRGHSLARDMYGNDAFNNGYLAANPANGNYLQINAIKQSTVNPLFYDVQTNIPIPTANPATYGYDFTRWIMRVSYNPTLASPVPYPVSQTFEILLDDYGQPGANNTQFSGGSVHAFRVSVLDSVNTSYNAPPNGTMPNQWTVLNNPTLGFTSSNTSNPFPGWGVGGAAQLAATMQAFNGGNVNNLVFTLDGRWLHAFNGPGLSSQATNPVTITYGNYSNVNLAVPLSTYGNFRYNTPILQNILGVSGPNAVGMDEDYDACDLENWFLAIQSADGQVMIPSFHRPGVVRYQDSVVGDKFDWDVAFRYPTGMTNTPNLDSLARILRPVAADGHDGATFPDLVPNPTTGKITYDVDNDGDGITDSVWVDLGYPARRDSAGNLYKPLFAFMVIGLNGRIPLNTAGNIAGTGKTHAQHLGNSVSEIDPTYGLQNAFAYNPLTNPTVDNDPFNQFGTYGNTGSTPPAYTPGAYAWPQLNQNTQVDNALNVSAGTYSPVDVRLIQLRNLLAGTRPQTNPLSNANLNNDNNMVFGSWPGTGAGATYYLPNSIADGADIIATTDSFGNPLVARTTPPVGGRWGEAASVPGVPFANPTAGGSPLNLVQSNYNNPVRAGYSLDISDIFTYVANGAVPYDSNGDPMVPSDSADDNYNAFDVWPPRMTGEVGDLDYYDSAGALILPVERMRRFVTPIDINGTGRVQTWGGGNHDYGPDNFGRVQFNSYFRPAGSAGQINIAENTTAPYGAIAPPASGGYGSWSTSGVLTLWTSGETYMPDVTNNPFHAYEFFKMPNTNQIAGTASPMGGTYNYQNVQNGGMPVTPSGNPPTTFPTYTNTTNSSQRLDGVNDADELNLYTTNPLIDSPYQFSDLEWLYRQQDVDGPDLTSRLSQLAPVSFTNTIDGLRRRRLYALHTWEPNNFVWTNDNPGGNFAYNAWFVPSPGAIGNVPSPLQNASAAQFSQDRNGVGYPGLTALPSLAHRDKKINLNYPLPVSNDCNEPIRQKWISDTYQLLKLVLPPTSVDSPEELAQLSQFVINIIDFRDPDATMTHWVNPDVMLNPGAPNPVTAGGMTTYYYTAPSLTANTGTTGGLDQYGMEYNPVAINEVLAYGFQSRTGPTTGSAVYTNRFFIELVNTLTAAYNPTYDSTNQYDPNNYYGYGTTNAGGNQTPIPPATTATPPPQQASTLDLGGFTYIPETNGLYDPYGAGCWDLVFTADNAMSRPDPYRGELVYNLNAATASPPVYTMFGLIPLNRDSVYYMSPTPATGGNVQPTNESFPNGGDVTLIPVSPNANNATGATSGGGGGGGGGGPGGGGTQGGGGTTNSNYVSNPPTAQPATGPPTSYFYVIGSPPNTSTSGGSTVTYEQSPIQVSSNQYPCVTQYFSTNPGAAVPYSFDPMNATAGPPPINYRAGILPAPSSTSQFGGLPGGQPMGPGGTTSVVPNFLWKLPIFGYSGASTVPAAPTAGSAVYYWVCLRRPANPFAPVSATNPMCVVDSMRFPYIDGTANVANSWPYINGVSGPVAPVTGKGTTSANTIFSAQRLQPYRGGHAVPVPNAPYSGITTTMPPDPRYGYTEQIAAPYAYTQSGGTYGLANPYTTGGNTAASTNYIFHTLGYNNDSAENWDYFVFNDRDFSSVAELMLVPGCPPGLFTKQFVEFAPSQMNAANIFSQVTPVITPTFSASFSGTAVQVSPPTSTATPNSMPAPFITATVPFLDVSQATVTSTVGSTPPAAPPPATSTPLPALVPAFSSSTNPVSYSGGYTQPTTATSPVQPHVFPYLVDKFFYTGASSLYYPPNGAVVDPGSVAANGLTGAVPVVGGPGGDGWFKMLEFFEVPSQMNGAIGTVAQGANFDWARQDIKPGLMNLNLIVDEEAFYAIFGRQSSSGMNQSLLNSIELPLLANVNANGQLVLPYGMPLGTSNGGNPPIPQWGPPVPLVVSAIQPTGAPNYVYPITDQTQYLQHGYLAVDPIGLALNTAASGATPPTPTRPYPVGSRIKAAFAQFLWARHGGSGYMFGFGSGATGQNSAVWTPNLSNYGLPIPQERPFHSLSYPDINFTVMRPAALPPSTFSNPAPTNPAALYITQTPTAPPPGTTPLYFSPVTPGPGLPGYFYSPFVTTGTAFAANTPIVYTGDPGLRNPFLNQGYVTGAIVSPTSPDTAPTVSPYIVYTAQTPYAGVPPDSAYQLPAGVPLPLNAALPTAPTPPATTPVIVADSMVMPPPIPPARLFQIPDYFGATRIQRQGYVGITSAGEGNIPPALSNATDSGDPWINNTVANQWSIAMPPPAPPSATYTLNHGFPSLMWGGGTYYPSAAGTGPLLTATGVLPPTSINYPPYGVSSPATTPGRLPLYNGYGAAPNNTRGPYLGNNTTGAATGFTDDRQHPYWRTELMQKAMNLTTVRTHQYAVWITIGFFEIKRQGDVSMLGQGLPQLAFDIMGPEVGALNGNNVRYRGFFIVDRLQLTGFNPSNVGAFHNAILYRKVLQ